MKENEWEDVTSRITYVKKKSWQQQQYSHFLRMETDKEVNRDGKGGLFGNV